MALSDGDIAQVRAATDIVALISEHVALRKSGRRWSGLCPFHTEKTPSFSVNAEEGRYYCFGCRASGDAITFVREVQHLDFVDAVRQLADRAGVELHEDASASAARHERQELLSAMAAAVDWYHDRLLHAPDARPAREYLTSRGIGGDLARQFRLGWAPDDWDALARALHLDQRVLTGTGLGFVNQRGRRQDAMRARIIFPILDPAGHPVALGGRILPGRDTGTRVEAKYKNSPETPIYSKRRTLYALNWAKEDVIKSGEIVVCEGYTDVIALFAAGVTRAVATCGTALGEEHFRTMRNFSQRIVLAYDADQAGQSAAASVYQWERQHEVDVAVARLPRGSDPAELAQRDPDALRRAVAEAVPFLAFRLERVLEAANLATAEGRARAAESALEVLREHPSELVRDQYVMEVADRLRLEAPVLRQRLREAPREALREAPVAGSRAAPFPARAPTSLPRPGQEALRLWVHVARARDRFVTAYFVDPVQRRVFDALGEGGSVGEVIDRLAAGGDVDAAGVLAHVVVDEVTEESDEAVAAVVSQLIRHATRTALRELEAQLRRGEITPDAANATIRDVKERLEWLGTDEASRAEEDLRDWLVAREASAP
ncbi:MAG: DNA primase [Acidimicrobiales bacterium]